MTMLVLLALTSIFFLFACFSPYRRNSKPPRRRSAARRRLASIIAGTAAFVLVYQLVRAGGLDHSAVLFVLVPAFFAVVIVLTEPARTSLGRIWQGVAVATLVAGMFLGEGIVCLIMASPLFFAVAGTVAALLQRIRAHDDPHRLSVIVLLLIVPLGLEGVVPGLTRPRTEVVRVERKVALTPTDVEAAISRPPRVAGQLPLYLRLGFPRPLAATGHGLEPGDARRIVFSAPKGGTAELILTVRERSADHITFRIDRDTTKVGSWLTWQTATVRWRPNDDGTSAVSWTFRYRRRLDPSWWFGPWQRYAVGLAADWLLDAHGLTAIEEDPS